jgi:hypothetical protein
MLDDGIGLSLMLWAPVIGQHHENRFASAAFSAAQPKPTYFPESGDRSRRTLSTSMSSCEASRPASIILTYVAAIVRRPPYLLA